MEKRFSKAASSPWFQIIVLVGFCLTIYFINLAQWDLWNPDEPRYAEVAREMVQSGEWVLMHRNGVPYAEKPPLFFWAIGISSFLWKEFTPFSVRLPSALFGTLTVLLTFFIGKRLYSARTGFLSGLILATSSQFFYLSTRGNIDTTLTFFITGSMLCFLRWDQARRGREHPAVRMRGLSFYGFYIGMALATLAKGPIGFILPLSVTLLFLLAKKDWQGIKTMRLHLGIPLVLGIVMAWYLPAVLKGGVDYFNTTLLHNVVDRFARGTSHIRPFYYYFSNFPSDYLPWFLFLPGAMVYGFSKGMAAKKREFLFLMIWFLFIFTFFTLSKGKRGIYLLPLFPAASIMIGKLWEDFISSSTKYFRQEWVTIPLLLLIGLILLAGVTLPLVFSGKPPFITFKLPPDFPYTFSDSLPPAFFLITLSIGLFLLRRLKYYGVIFFLIIGFMAGGFLYTLRVVFPLVNPYKSARFICQEINSRIQPGEKLAIFGDFEPGPYNFYTGIVPILMFKEEEALLKFLRTSERVYCLFKFRDFLRIEHMEGLPQLQLIARRPVGDSDFVLISNR